MSFRSLTDLELHALPDEEVIAYGREAREAGAHRDARTALAMLVWGYERSVLRRVRMKVPEHVALDVADEVIVKAVAAAFDGQSVGEFRSWLNTITDRTCADYFRRAKARPNEVVLPSEHAGEDDIWQSEPSVPSEAGAVELRVIVEQVLAALDAVHRHVIELHIFGQHTAAEVCDRIEGMSEANVAQIASRFRARLRERLAAGDSP